MRHSFGYAFGIVDGFKCLVFGRGSLNNCSMSGFCYLVPAADADDRLY